MADQTYDQVKEEWARQVGWFSISMGEVEAGVSQALDLIGKAAGKNDSLDARITRLRKNLKLAHPTLIVALGQCVDEADRLRDLRNTVLHSAIRVEGWYEGIPEDRPVRADELEGKKLYWRSKVFDRKEKHNNIDLKEMSTLVTSAKSLSDCLWKLVIMQWEILESASPKV